MILQDRYDKINFTVSINDIKITKKRTHMSDASK